MGPESAQCLCRRQHGSERRLARSRRLQRLQRVAVEFDLLHDHRHAPDDRGQSSVSSHRHGGYRGYGPRRGPRREGDNGYVLIVEGAIPTADNGAYCELWPGTSALQGVQEFGANAALVLAVGTCAAYGGIPGAQPNPTGIQSVSQVLQGKTVVNLPGCPTHPDWIVGSIAEVLAGGTWISIPMAGRPFSMAKRHTPTVSIWMTTRIFPASGRRGAMAGRPSRIVRCGSGIVARPKRPA